MKLGLKDLFKDLTWMQVGAGALAAATSLFFASSIGIAGSVIGAAVGSIVTTVSSALYKSFLTASNDAIKEKIVGPDDHGENPAGDAEESGPRVGGAHFAPAAGTPGEQPAVEQHAAQLTAVQPPAAQETAVLPGPGTASAPTPHAAGGATVPLPPAGASLDRTQAMPRAVTRDPQEAARVRELSQQRKRQRTEKLVVLVSLVTGLIAVLGCALVVYTATNGTGLGYRPEPVVRPSVVEPGVELNDPADPSGDNADAPGTDEAPSGPADAAPTPPATETTAPPAAETPGTGDTTVTAPQDPATPEGPGNPQTPDGDQVPAEPPASETPDTGQSPGTDPAEQPGGSAGGADVGTAGE